MKTITQREAFVMMGIRPETVERYSGAERRFSPFGEPRYPIEVVERILAALRGE